MTVSGTPRLSCPAPASALRGVPSVPLLQVIKLDVDTQSVEIPFMRAVQADADLRSRIGEILFEMHYIHQ